MKNKLDTQRTYVPILKAKEGEYKAFPDLDPTLRTIVVPMFEILPLQDTDVDGHINQAAEKFAKHLINWPRVMIDFGLVDGGARMRSSIHPVEAFFARLRLDSVNGVPVVSLASDIAYLDAVANVIATDHRGMCLRLKIDDMSTPHLASGIDSVLRTTGCAANNTDLVVDFGPVSNGKLAALTATTAFKGLPNVQEWRTLSFAGTAFPESLASVPLSSFTLIERKEWTAWMALRSAGLPRMPGFGDYGISHPELPKIDPRIMSMSANIRYTTNGSWLCAKGKGVKLHGYGQFFSLCADLVKRREFAGPAFSQGDRHISDCAAKRTTCGNATTWRWVGNVHHITAVAREIASLS
jgi:hypothetical protein